MGTVHKRYKELEARREPFLDRARDAAKLTIPSLLPPQAHTSTSQLPTPYQSLGARGTNNLASKLLLTLFPPNSPFFKFSVDPSLLEDLSRQDEGVRSSVEQTLGKMERMVMKKFEAEAIRPVVFQALRQLIVAGNVLFYLPLDGSGARMFRLDHFVVRRDSSGNPLEIIVWEKVSPKHLPPEAQDIVSSSPEETSKDASAEGDVDLYTYIAFEGGKWKVFQELKGQTVPGSEGSYNKDDTPWLPLTFTRVHGEDYGRGYIEEYLGDLIEVEGLSKAMSEATAAMAKFVILVRPGGVTDLRDVIEAENLEAIEGREEDVSCIQFNKAMDLRVSFEQKQELVKSLSYAFLLHSAVQRNAERVTAEEIRFMAQELEDALGGVYSVQSIDFQLPLVKLLRKRMERKNELPRMPKEIDLDVAITTGIEALGRGHDLNKLDLFISGALQLGQDQAAQAINWSDYMTRRATAIGLDTEGLIKSPEQLAQEAQQAQMMAMAQQLGPQAISQMGGLAKEGMKQQQGE